MAFPQKQRKPRQRQLARTVGAVLPNKSGIGFHIASPTEVVKTTKVNLPFPSKRSARRNKRAQVFPRVLAPAMRPPARRQGGPRGAFGGPNQRVNQQSMRMRVTEGGETLQGARRQVITQDEYIGVINGTNSATPTVTAYPVNPGQAGTFPWLAKMALLFEKYSFIELEFYFKTRCSQFLTQGQGAIVLSHDYDASDSPPATLQQVLDMEPHVDDVPYNQLVLKLDPFDLNDGGGRKGKYVRPGGLPGAADIKTYDAGNLFVTTVNNGSTLELGELRVRYKVELQIPVLENTASAPANNQVALFSSSGAEGMTTTVQYTFLMAAATPPNGIGAVNTNGVITPPAGNYLVDASVVFVDSMSEAITIDLALYKNAGPVGNGAVRPVFKSSVDSWRNCDA
jgi:hypothetical protein